MMKRTPLTKAETEAMLDDLVPKIIKKSAGKQAFPGWYIVAANWPFDVKFMSIRDATFPDDVVYVPTLTEEWARKLVARAKKDATAFDAARYIAGVNIAALSFKGWPAIPESLRLFGAGILMGINIRPAQKGRPRIDDVPLRMDQYLCCRVVQTGAVVQLARNRESNARRNFSACDAVAEAFTRGGHCTAVSSFKCNS